MIHLLCLMLSIATIVALIGQVSLGYYNAHMHIRYVVALPICSIAILHHRNRSGTYTCNVFILSRINLRNPQPRYYRGITHSLFICRNKNHGSRVICSSRLQSYHLCNSCIYIYTYILDNYDTVHSLPRITQRFVRRCAKFERMKSKTRSFGLPLGVKFCDRHSIGCTHGRT